MSDFIKRLLNDSGIKEGYKVLDVGCGFGDVTFMVAEMIGASGEITGVDFEEFAILGAKKRLKTENTNIKFLTADINSLPEELKDFDAIVGRRVLMYQKDSVATLKNLASRLKKDGRIIFQESDSTMKSVCLKQLPLHEKAQNWIWETVKREGGNLQMGMHLYSDFLEAGYSVQNICAEAIIQTPQQNCEIGKIVNAMHNRIVKHGVATLEELGLDTLDARLAKERDETNTVFIRDFAFGICGFLVN